MSHGFRLDLLVGSGPRACDRAAVLLLAFAASLLLHLAITQWDVRFSDPVEAAAAAHRDHHRAAAPAGARASRSAEAQAQAQRSRCRCPRPCGRGSGRTGRRTGRGGTSGRSSRSVAGCLRHSTSQSPQRRSFRRCRSNLPPRIDLAYRGFLGTRGFFIGDAVYRLEHSANQYKISTVGEARGLAALAVSRPGQGDQRRRHHRQRPAAEYLQHRTHQQLSARIGDASTGKPAW